jgi:hypothetical protein
MKEKVSCQGLPQLTDFAPLAPALARFGRVGREATNQKVGSSNPPGRTTSSSYGPPQCAGVRPGRLQCDITALPFCFSQEQFKIQKQASDIAELV